MTALATESTHHALYRFYNEAGDLLYVGMTANPAARWGQHRQDKPWWSEVARVSLESHPTRESVQVAERVAIIAENPRYNVTHNRGRTPRRRVDRELAPGYCAGSSEVASMLGVSRQRVFQLACESDFPTPLARLALGHVWRTQDIRVWAEEKGREVHE